MKQINAGETGVVNVEDTAPVNGAALDVDRQAMADVDAAIAQAVEVMSVTREQIARTLRSRTGETSGEAHVDNSPVAMIAGSRRRILDQMNASRAAINGGQTNDTDRLLRLNAQMADRIANLTRELAIGKMTAKLYLVELRTEVGNYLDCVDNMLNNRVTVQLS